MGNTFDYPPPPHVRERGTITVQPEVTRRRIVRELRAAAECFRNLLKAPDGWGQRTSQLFELCGQLLIDAQAAELVPSDQLELAELITHHRQPSVPWPEGFKGVRVPPGPVNLFDDVNGGNWVGVVAVSAGRFKPGKVYGGLMPRWDPGHLSKPKAEQCAATCEFLADMLETGDQMMTVGPSRHPYPTVTKEEIKIIQFLATRTPTATVNADIQVGAELAKATVENCVNSLLGKKLVDRPAGTKRKGVVLTARGLDLAKTLPSGG